MSGVIRNIQAQQKAAATAEAEALRDKEKLAYEEFSRSQNMKAGNQSQESANSIRMAGLRPQMEAEAMQMHRMGTPNWVIELNLKQKYGRGAGQ
jgi:hypothetical protein